MNMSVRVVVLLSTLFLQTSSAPSGCLESCNIFHQVNSYQTHHTSGSVNSHSDSAQEVTNLTNQNYLNFDHTKPDNWTEHNEYRTNNGHGKVYEEQGQYITGPKRVKYFKKNYTSSYNTDFAGSPELVNQERLNTHVTYDSGTRPHSEYFQRIYESKGSESYRQDHGHNRLQTDRLQPVYDRRESDSERLRNIEELKYSSQKIQQSTSGIGSQNFQIQDYNSETDHGNWSTVNSYRTDRGHGQVFEENGQYVTGPNKIRYYRRNYTSGYTTNNAPVSGTRLIGDQDLQREMLGLNREFDNFGQEIHQSTHSKQITASNTLNTNFPSLNQEIKESNARINGQNTQYNNINQGLLYVRPSDKVYDINRQSTHHETNTRTYQSHPNIQSQKISSDYIHVPTDERYQQRYTQNLRETEHNINTNYKMTPLHEHEYTYNQHRDIYPSRTEQIKHYQEHWTSSSQPKETSRIYINTNANNMQLAEEIRAQHERNQESEHVDCIQESEQIQHGYTKRYKRNIQHKELNDAIQQESKLKRLPLRMYDQEDFSQQNTHKPTQLVNENQHLDDFNQQSENLMQQNTGIFKDEQQIYQPYREGKFDIGSQQLDNVNQQSDDLSQKPGEFDDLTQPTTGKQEHQQQTYQSYSKPGRMEIGTQRLHHYNKQNEDETQQISGKLEFGQEVYYPHRSGNHEYNKQELESINQQNEDLQQQTDGFDDLTQQTAGKQEHQQQTYQSYSKPGRMEIGTQRLHHYNKQNEDETQQISGKLEFGQEVYYPRRSGNHEYNKQELESINQQNEDLQQQTDGFDDLTQTNSGKQEHQQQTYQSYSPGRMEIGTQRLHHYNKQNEDETQQISGKLEFGQEVYYPHRSGNHEYNKQELESINQQNEDLQQQTDGFDDLTQTNSGKQEHQQQTYQSYSKPGRMEIGTQRLHHYNKQNEDETQQISGKLEFGQEVYYPHRSGNHEYNKRKLESINQQNENLQQQTDGFDDLTQQTGGKQEHQQQTYQSYSPGRVEIDTQDLHDYNKQNKDETQQTSSKLEFGQEVYYPYRSTDHEYSKQELEHIDLQNKDFIQQTDRINDSKEKNIGELEDLQQTYQSYKPEKVGIVNEQLHHYNKQNEDEIQQTSGKLELGQVYHPHTLEKDKFDKQKLEDIDQQNNVFMQEIGKHYDFTQQNNGKKADLQQTYQSYEPGKVEIGKEQLEHYNKQNEEKTQQTIGKFDFGGVSQSHRSKDLDFTKQELEDIKQQNEDLVQQTAGFHDFTPQTTGKLTHHQQSYELYGSERREINNQQLQHYGEQNKDEIQRTRGELEISNLDQELNYEQNNSDGVQQIANTNYGIPLYIPKLAPTPAPKPKPKLRYHERDQMQNNDTESNNNFYNYNYKYSELNNTNENTKNVHEPIEPNIDNMKYREIRRGDQEVRIPVSNNTNLSQQFQNNNNNINNTSNYTNQMNWAHRSNSNISDLNWYYTHHINNLTNNKNSQINSEQMSQQTQFSLPQSTYSQQPDVINYGQQQTRTNAGFIKNSYRHRNQQSNQTPYSYHVQQNNYEQQLGSFKRSEIQNSQHLSPIQDNDSDVKVEPRILEAYGAGPYDANHSDDIYSRVTLNPSVTLPPYVSGIDPWDIREKPKDAVTESSITVKPLTVETFDTFETTTQTETPPSIWLRFRHKLTNTFDKAKEKARDIFG